MIGRQHASGHRRQARGARRRLPPAAAAAALAVLLVTACGADRPERQPGDRTAITDGATGAAPPGATADGDRLTDAAVAAVADPPLEPPAPRTRRELVDSNDAAPFERFLAGPWYRRTEPDGDDPRHLPGEIIHFEPGQRHVTLFDGEVQEIYTWNASELWSPARLAIRMHNANVTSVEKTVVVEVIADDELDLTMRSGESDGESDHNGTYRRLGEAARRELVGAGAAQPGLAPLKLSGRYHGSDGQTIDFDAPGFTWQQHDRRLSGGFAVYSAGQPVVVFKVVSAAGATREVRTYAVEFREHRGDKRVRRSLILHPATLGITGLAAAGSNALHFEQVELADAADTDGGDAGTGAAPADG